MTSPSGTSTRSPSNSEGATTASYTGSAGPVISTGWPAPSQLISRGPPGRSTRAWFSHSPSRWQATNVAQAPVPQARVGPAPRSHTRIARWLGARTCTKWTFVRAGKAG